MFISWIKPLIFFLSMFGIKPMFYIVDDEDGDGKEIDKDVDDNEDKEVDENPEDKTEETEINDETDLLNVVDVELLDSILDREDVDLDKFLELTRTVHSKPKDEQKILLRDIKISKEDDPDKEKSDEEPIVPDASEKDQSDKNKSSENKAEDKTTSENKDTSKDENSDKTEESDKGKKPWENKNVFTVTEDFIKNSVKKFQEENKDKHDAQTLDRMVGDYENILNSIIGRTLDQKMLNNYVNAETYIHKIKTPFDKDWKPDENITKDPDYIKIATEQKNKMITQAIQREFPDFPNDGLSNKDARIDFIRALNEEDPEAYDKFKSISQDVENDINDKYDRYYYITKNWKTMAKSTIEADVEFFNMWLDGKGLKPEDIGAPDLKLDDKDYNEFIYNKILYKDKDHTNDDVLTFMDDKYPIIKPESVFNKLKDLFEDAVLMKREEAAREEGYKLGQNAQIEPSLSESEFAGQKDEIVISDDVFDDDDASLDQIEKGLQAVKDKMLGNSKFKRRK